MSISHKDRRHLGTPVLTTGLEAGAIVQTLEDGTIYKRLPLSDVREVRLTVEMAARASQVVCRVKDDQGLEIVFGSMAFISPGVFESRIESFQPLLRALHAALLPYSTQIRFLEGQSKAFMLTMFILGGAIAALGAFFFVVLFLLQERPAGLFLIAVFAAGIWLMQLFRPRAEKCYDPAAYATSPEEVSGA